jgi:hypothetical protein
MSSNKGPWRWCVAIDVTGTLKHCAMSQTKKPTTFRRLEISPSASGKGRGDSMLCPWERG